MAEIKHLGLRLYKEQHDQLKKMAEFDGRSINSEVNYLIREIAKEYNEKFHLFDEK